MKTQTAIKIGIECIEKKMMEYAVDANLFRLGVVISPRTTKCHKELTRLEDAVKGLKELLR